MLVARVISLVTASTISAGVLYDWAFFQATKTQLMSVMTLQDHINSALEWLPGTLILYALVMGTTIWEVDNPDTVGRVPIWLKLLRAISDDVKIHLGVLGFGIWAVFLPASYVWVAAISSILAVVGVINRIIQSGAGRTIIGVGPTDQLNFANRSAIFFVGWLAVISAFRGYSEGASAIEMKDGGSVVHFLSGETHDYQKIIRYTEKGLIYFDPIEKRLRFTLWTQIGSVNTRKVSL